jgi:4'-phosphopantetheinyl transferase EntD
MSKTTSELSHALAGLAAAAHPALRSGCRPITLGDECALTEAELAPVRNAVTSVRRATGTARILARALLAEAGGPCGAEIPRARSGAPRWPPGFVGSLAHDAEFAVAVVAPSQSVVSVGVDLEPALPLPGDLLDLVATPAEQRQLDGNLLLARLLFCMKEAVYKATHPVDGAFLEHHDVEVCLESRTAVTRFGRVLRIHTADRPRLLALTILERGNPCATSDCDEPQRRAE